MVVKNMKEAGGRPTFPTSNLLLNTVASKSTAAYTLMQRSEIDSVMTVILSE